jgi:hypothetical protein
VSEIDRAVSGTGSQITGRGLLLSMLADFRPLASAGGVHPVNSRFRPHRAPYPRNAGGIPRETPGARSEQGSRPI